MYVGVLIMIVMYVEDGSKNVEDGSKSDSIENSVYWCFDEASDNDND